MLFKLVSLLRLLVFPFSTCVCLRSSYPYLALLLGTYMSNILILFSSLLFPLLLSGRREKHILALSTCRLSIDTMIG